MTSRASGRSRVPARPSRPSVARRPGAPGRSYATGTSQEVAAAATRCRTRAARRARCDDPGRPARSARHVRAADRHDHDRASTCRATSSPTPVQLRVCNEEAPAGCTLSGVQNVQTYGRLDRHAQRRRRPAVNGKTPDVDHHRHQQRRPGVVAIQVDGGAATGRSASGGRVASAQRLHHRHGTTTRTSASGALYDAAPGGRGRTSGRTDHDRPAAATDGQHLAGRLRATTATRRYRRINCERPPDSGVRRCLVCLRAASYGSRHERAEDHLRAAPSTSTR